MDSAQGANSCLGRAQRLSRNPHSAGRLCMCKSGHMEAGWPIRPGDHPCHDRHQIPLMKYCFDCSRLEHQRRDVWLYIVPEFGRISAQATRFEAKQNIDGSKAFGAHKPTPAQDLIHLPGCSRYCKLLRTCLSLQFSRTREVLRDMACRSASTFCKFPG